jgi:uncharacterized membrane protein
MIAQQVNAGCILHLLKVSTASLSLAVVIPLIVNAQTPDFSSVQSILEDNCVMCHNGPKAPKGLRLDSYGSLMKGSERGAVVRPKVPAGSEIVKRIRGVSTPRMPLSGPPWLEESDITLIEKWIEAGATDSPSQNKEPLVTEHKPAVQKDGKVTYADVAPLLRMRCVKCHNSNGLLGPPPEGLILASYRQLMNEPERVYVVPGNPDASELIRKIRGESLPRMPFDGPPYLSADEIRLVEKWVLDGARDEQGVVAPVPVHRRVRLGGTLTGFWKLDSLPLTVDAGTELKKKTGIGSYVEVRGLITPDGGVRADRIRARRPGRGDDD